MSKKQVRSKRSRPAKVASTRVGVPPEGHPAQGQLERGVREIEKVIADIQHGLARAERRIEADARQRIRALQKEGRAQVRALEARRREVARLIGELSAAAGGSLDDITKAVHAMVADARTGAVTVIDRFRNVLS